VPSDRCTWSRSFNDKHRFSLELIQFLFIQLLHMIRKWRVCYIIDCDSLATYCCATFADVSSGDNVEPISEQVKSTMSFVNGYGLLYPYLMPGVFLTYRLLVMMYHYRTQLHISFPHSITICLHFDNPIKITSRHSTSPTILQSLPQLPSCVFLCTPLPFLPSPSRNPSPSEV